MSDTDGTCEYVLDPEDPETWGGEEGDECYVSDRRLNEQGVWTCPHAAYENRQFCIFHTPVNNKDNEEVKKEFIYAVKGGKKRYREFIGANFGDLQEKNISVTGQNPLVLTHTSFIGEVDFSYSTFSSAVIAEGTEWNSRANFQNVVFCEEVHISNSIFKHSVQFSSAIFKSGFYCLDSVFESSVGFGKSEFNYHAQFSGVSFNGLTKFYQATFNEEARFINALFTGSAFFAESNISSSSFESAVFSSANFKGANLSDSSFRDAVLKGSKFQKSNLTGSDLSGSYLKCANLERCLLSRSDLFDANLTACKFYGAVFGDAQINGETEFGDRCVYDPEFDNDLATDVDDNQTDPLTKAAGQYRIIEQLARTNAFPDMVSHNFIRRQEIHREQHQQEGRWGRWLRATASKYVLEYGENPWRLIATGIITVVTFGLLYPLVGGLQPTGGSTITVNRTIDNPILLLQSIYYSTLTFTTLGMGDFLPVGLGRVLTTLETSLGAIIIALLVFVFGRRAAR